MNFPPIFFAIWRAVRRVVTGERFDPRAEVAGRSRYTASVRSCSRYTAVVTLSPRFRAHVEEP